MVWRDIAVGWTNRLKRVKALCADWESVSCLRARSWIEVAGMRG